MFPCFRTVLRNHIRNLQKRSQPYEQICHGIQRYKFSRGSTILQCKWSKIVDLRQGNASV